MDLWLETAAKVLAYATALVAVGAVAARRLLLPRVGPQVAGESLLVAGARADRILRTATLCLLLSLLMRAWAHTVSAFGVADGSTWDNLTLIAIESQWGGGWLMQLAAAVVLLGVAISAVRGAPLAGWLSAVAIALLCLAVPQTGHAAGHPLRVVTHAAHVLAGGAWLGTLAVVVFGMPREMRVPLLRGFAPVAATSVAMVGLSGLAMTLTYLGPLSNLWLSDYGRLLLLKLAVVGMALVIGGLNWRALHRSGGRTPGRLPILEASLVLAIVTLTAWLTETAHP